MCRLSRNSGSLNILEIYGPVQACTGIALTWCPSRQDGDNRAYDISMNFISLTSVKEILTRPKQSLLTLPYKAEHAIINPTVMSQFPLHIAQRTRHSNAERTVLLYLFNNTLIRSPLFWNVAPRHCMLGIRRFDIAYLSFFQGWNVQ
jgi:hypothetical protein